MYTPYSTPLLEDFVKFINIQQTKKLNNNPSVLWAYKWWVGGQTQTNLDK